MPPLRIAFSDWMLVLACFGHCCPRRRSSVCTACLPASSRSLCALDTVLATASFGSAPSNQRCFSAAIASLSFSMISFSMCDGIFQSQSNFFTFGFSQGLCCLRCFGLGFCFCFCSCHSDRNCSVGASHYFLCVYGDVGWRSQSSGTCVE